jgi:hypothetical protein
MERVICTKESILHPVITCGAIAVRGEKSVELIEGPRRQKPSHGELVNRLGRIAEDSRLGSSTDGSIYVGSPLATILRVLGASPPVRIGSGRLPPSAARKIRDGPDRKPGRSLARPGPKSAKGRLFGANLGVMVFTRLPRPLGKRNSPSNTPSTIRVI